MNCLLLLSFLTVITNAALPTPTALGQFSIYSTSFLNIDRWDASSPWMLLSSAFGVLEGDGVWIVPDLAHSFVIGFNYTQPVLLTSEITWPNEVHVVPFSIGGSNRLLSICYGFLVPTKSTGGIYLMDIQNGNNLIKLTTDKSGFFYHRLRWYDVDGDGKQDIITCRAEKPLFTPAGGELIWLKQPSSNPLSGSWPTYTITTGCDMLWELVDIDKNGVPEVVAAEFFGEQVTLYYPANGKWNDTNSIKSVVIDNNIGPAFDVKVYDIDNDGVSELIATNHKGDGTGGVYAYDVPLSWKVTGSWNRHTIAEGFVIRESGYNQAAPGGGIPFYPIKGMTGKKWIALSGDGSQHAYQLAPTSPNSWDFSRSLLIDTKATVGQVAVEDINGDGYYEVLVPAYDTGIVYAYTYKPQ